MKKSECEMSCDDGVAYISIPKIRNLIRRNKKLTLVHVYEGDNCKYINVLSESGKLVAVLCGS